ncbi:MAG: hypothetical protein Hyperionvirus34_7 [Hyperionvirus sp.]|uniref:Sel1 repeat family protein n=1 Tax=Hyperionvirus sp. TaxID=2487770 RepID=A0A3G5AFL7_9VIRU|nr:MAG: hypothetical protein Hyperionvirus34_7 [Hyperionvirus sp.]
MTQKIETHNGLTSSLSSDQPTSTMFMTLKDVKHTISKRIGTPDISYSADRNDSIYARIKKLDQSDRKDLFDWLMATPQYLDPCIKNLIGLCYGNSIGVEQNIETSIKWHEAAGNLGNHFGYRNAAIHLIDTGKNKTPDERDRIIILLRKSIKLGNDDAMYLLGVIYDNEKNTTQSLALFEQSAAAGNPSAMEKLGTIYETRNELKLAIIWIEKAIKVGRISLMDYLGQLHFRMSDYPTAILWFNKSIFCGNTRSFANLARTYFRLNNTEKAIEIYKQGVAANDPSCMICLAAFYINEEKQTVSDAIIIDLCTRANNPISYSTLAIFYERKKADKINAAKYYLLAYSKKSIGINAKLTELFDGLSRDEYLLLLSFYAKYDNLEKENQLLKEKVATLTTELTYRPGGIGEKAAEKNFHLAAAELGSI